MSVIEVASAAAPTALVVAAPTILTTQTAPGVYQLTIDTFNLVAGDVLVIRSRIMVVSGGSSRLFEEEVLAGVTAAKMWTTEPISVAWEVQYELEQTAHGGSGGKVIPWAVLRS